MRVEIAHLLVLRDGFPAVDGVSLTLDGGVWTGVVGANGSGKTSLLRALAGRIDAAAGSIVVDGENRVDDRAWRAQAFGFAPDPASLPQTLTGRELFSILVSETPGRGEADPLFPLRRALGFDAFLDRRIGTLSAGMRQRLAIFCAFLQRSRLVILDEPFNWLDPVCAFDTREALKELVAREELSLVTALHEMATLTSHCDRGLLLSGGKAGLELGPAELRAGARDFAAFEAGIIGLLRSPSGAA
ncbi:ATP-binding cassette domain-containing protein [Allosphingosinicella sp.]|jgi:ABC-type multidrug transport system ATPase subunit|uniref:ATP-binding cassette domain-containing protein n=1 Tax=Allosphingosinicella sp. TaxID=2823234 RepID=UPI002EF790E5